MCVFLKKCLFGSSVCSSLILRMWPCEVQVVLDFSFFFYLFFLTFIYDGRFILFLIPHPWKVPRDRLSGCFPEPLILLPQFSWLNLRVSGGPGSQRCTQRLTLAVFCLLAHAHGTQRQSAVCQVPAGQRAYCFWKSRPDPQTLGSTQQSLWGNSVSVCEQFDTNRGAVCFCVKACI